MENSDVAIIESRLKMLIVNVLALICYARVTLMALIGIEMHVGIAMEVYVAVQVSVGYISRTHLQKIRYAYMPRKYRRKHVGYRLASKRLCFHAFHLSLDETRYNDNSARQNDIQDQELNC